MPFDSSSYNVTMPKESFYNLEKAQSEAEKIKGLVGEKGEGGDYSAAEKLLEETGEIELVDFDAEESGSIKAQAEKTIPSIISEKQKEGAVKREPKPYAYKEIDRLGEKLSDFKKSARGARSKETQNAYEEKIKFFREELEKAKTARDVIKEKTESRNSKFERLLKDKFEELKNGTWESAIPEIDSIQIYQDKPNEEGKIESLGINVFWEKDGETHTAHFKLLKDGSLAGKMPIERGLNIDKDELVDDILHTVETVNMNFFEYLDEEILQPGETGIFKPRTRERRERGEVEKGKIDPRRLEFMKNQEKAIFGFASKKSGFDGYYGFVFPNFFVLDHKKIGNAAFFVNLEESLDIDQKRFKLSSERRATKEERMAILKNYIEKYINSSRTQIVSMGAKQKYHPHMGNEKWEEKMQQEIDKRLTNAGN